MNATWCSILNARARWQSSLKSSGERAACKEGARGVEALRRAHVLQ